MIDLPGPEKRASTETRVTGAFAVPKATVIHPPFSCDDSASEFEHVGHVLPPDVSSMTEWGQTIIEFGKYEHKKMTYMELTQKGDDESKGYIKYVRDRVKSSKGQFHDLALFLEAYYQDDSVIQGAVIPGTNTVRKMKRQ